ncbi:MAG: hypothetical protein ABIJ09_16065, partial [Pseudomonadota bacterium]
PDMTRIGFGRLSKVLSAPGFRKNLGYGKYTRWAAERKAGELYSILCLLEGLRTEDPKLEVIDVDLHRLLSDLTERTRAWKEAAKPYVRDMSGARWLRTMTGDDLVGILWAIGEVTCRYPRERGSMEDLHQRCAMNLRALICITRMETSEIRVGGPGHPLNRHGAAGEERFQ